MQLFLFLKKRFVKNVLTLITGSTISQLIIYAAIPLLTRLFSEELFGVYILFSSLVIIIKPLLSLHYELAIVLPKRNKDAINLVAFTIIILFLFSIVLFLIFLFFNNSIASLLNIESLSHFIYFIPLSVFLSGSISVFDYWNNRNDMFKNISKGLVGKSSVMGTSQVLIGFSSLNYIGLVPGIILGQIAQLLILLNLSFKTIAKFASHISIRRMYFLIKKYKDIPAFNTLISFTNTLSNELPVLLITRYFGLESAGIYGLSIKVGKAPVGIIEQSVSQVFFNKASKVYNAGEDLHKVIKKVVKNLLAIGFVVFIPLMVISFFLDIIFGENWSESGIYLRIILPWLFIAFLSSPITSLMVILNKQKTILNYNILLLIFRFLTLYLGYKIYDDILISLMLFSLVGVIYNISIIIYFLKITKNNYRL